MRLISKHCFIVLVGLLFISAIISTADSLKYQLYSQQTPTAPSSPYAGGILGWPIMAINGTDIFPWHGSCAPLIAILDTGVDTSNPFLRNSNIRQIVIDRDGNYSSELHGTMVAGLIVSNGNGWSTPGGLIPNANLLSIQVGTDSGTSTQQLAAAIVLAVNEGAKIINISLGAPSSSPELEKAVEYAISQGVIIVAASGNQNLTYNNYPAAYEDVIAVSSLSANQKLGNNTNYDFHHNIAAPGDFLLTTGPLNKTNQSKQWISGSSASAPLVTSLVAVLLSNHPSLNASQVRQIILDSARNITIDGQQIKVLDVKAAIKLSDTMFCFN